MRLANGLVSSIVFAISIAFVSTGYAQAQAKVNKDLIEKADSRGSVRVIVTLNTAFTPEGKLPGAASIGQQRAAIASAQGRIMKTLKSGLAKVGRAYKSVPHLAMEVDANTLYELTGLDDVTAIEEDVPVPPIMSSSNEVINAPTAWAGGYTGAGQVVAILDTGVDKTHPYFSTGGNKIVSEACFSSNYSGEGIESISICPGGIDSSFVTDSGIDCVTSTEGYSNAQQDCKHGTHVAGSAVGNDGNGPHFGVAPDADIIAIQIFSLFPRYCNGSACVLTWSSDQIAALAHVYELRDTHSIASVNMSIGGGRYFGPCDTAPQKNAIDNLHSVGIATVIASGNDGFRDSIGSPACVSSAVSVGATDDNDKVAYFSNVADFLDVFVPGVSITSALPGGGTGTWQGTSMATPHVAGAWAVMKQANPSASVDDVLSKLKSSGVPINDQRTGGSATGIPRIDVAQAVGDGGIRMLGFENGSHTIDEDAGPITINIVRSGNPAGYASVNFATFEGSAESPGDYEDNSGFLSWSDNETGVKSISVSINDDNEVEPIESFTVNLSSPTGAELGSNSTATVSINDNDLVPPEPTTASAVNNGDGSATISWVDVGNETQYQIQREKQHKKQGWNGTTTIATTSADTIWLIDSSGAGTFRWRVRASNDAGSSTWSDWAEVIVTDGGGGNQNPKPCRGNRCN